MSKRRDELKRVIKYAEGLGLKVVRKRYTKGDPSGTYDHNNLTIELYEWPSQSLTRKILILLHELGHHMDWVHISKQRESQLLNKALEKDWERDKKLKTSRQVPPIAKYLRRHIYNSEKRAINYMPVVFNELRLSIPRWKLKLEMELDTWVYLRYYQSGKYPSRNETAEWISEWRKRNEV